MKTSRSVAAIAFAVMIVINGLANIIPLNGLTTGDVSNAYPNLFAPAAITFSIWSVIYILLAAYTLYQIGVFKHKQITLKDKVIDKITPFYIASSLVNATWIVTWHYQMIWLSVGLMIGLLYCLGRIVNILKNEAMTPVETAVVRAPFSVYFGWITVALIANITTWLVSMNWTGGGISPEIWTLVILIVGTIISIYTALRNSDWIYLLVPVWAYFGIIVKHILPNGWNGSYLSIIMVATALMAVMALVAGYLINDNRQTTPRKKFWIF